MGNKLFSIICTFTFSIFEVIISVLLLEGTMREM